jgi:hypothetical protein
MGDRFVGIRRLERADLYVIDRILGNSELTTKEAKFTKKESDLEGF